MSTKTLKQNKEVNFIKERVRWAIGYICDNFKMTNEKIAKDMGCATSTINSYRCKVTLPGMDFSAYMKKFNFSSNWLDSGAGEPFLGAYAKFPDVCGPAGSVSGVRESMPPYDALIAEQKINIEESIGKAYKVLSSGTALAAALYLNIQQFSAALETGQELRVCQDQIKNMQSQIDELKGWVQRLSATPTTPGETAAGSEKKAM